jgi:hypothetical protein
MLSDPFSEGNLSKKAERCEIARPIKVIVIDFGLKECILAKTTLRLISAYYKQER